MQNPEDTVRTTIRRFIKDNSQHGIRTLITLFEERQNAGAMELIAQNTPQRQINERLERSNRIFDEQLLEHYPYRPHVQYVVSLEAEKLIDRLLNLPPTIEQTRDFKHTNIHRSLGNAYYTHNLDILANEIYLRMDDIPNLDKTYLANLDQSLRTIKETILKKIPGSWFRQ